MLASNGSVASQGGFKGIVWDYGNILSLPLNSNAGISGTGFYCTNGITPSSGTTYYGGIDVSSLNIKGVSIELNLYGPVFEPYSNWNKVRIVYADDTFTNFDGLIDGNVTININQTKNLKFIQMGAYNYEYGTSTRTLCRFAKINLV